jgi:hypothetical protein
MLARRAGVASSLPDPPAREEVIATMAVSRTASVISTPFIRFLSLASIRFTV